MTIRQILRSRKSCDDKLDKAVKSSLDSLKKLGRRLKKEFKSLDFLIEAVAAKALVGQWLNQNEADEAGYAELDRQYGLFDKALAKGLEKGELQTDLASMRDKHGFVALDMEILLLLAGSSVGMGPRICDIDDLQNYFPRSYHNGLEIARVFLTENRLLKSGMVIFEQSENFKTSSISAASGFVNPILRAKGRFVTGWECESQEELLNKLYLLHNLLECCANEVGSRIDETDDNYKEKAELNRFLQMFEHSVKPDWGLAALFNEHFNEWETIILFSLLCRAWLVNQHKHHFSCDDDLYVGDGLARSAADHIMDVPKIVKHCLMPSSQLLRDGFIKPIVTGTNVMQEEDDDAARGFSYELTDDFLERLEVKRRKTKREVGRKPLLGLDRLVLAEPVREGIAIATNQFSRRDKLDKWDLAKVIPYGRAVTLLFSGPPGVGKTAAAEAIADHLHKNILVADYSKIQNCYVGETEKNVVKIFREASEGDCLLFWDEADAMFYDRDSAERNWEVRDVNVLLQELEKFAGVCILSTNRKVTLDKALARRISLKIEFEPPTQEQARLIWEKLLPKNMPLASDVNLDLLARTPLTGGEIKNAVLNAARRAAGRDGVEAVAMDDFLWALKSEEAGKDLSGIS